MTDVRLTALNPADSSPVPVACDDAGRLLLEPIDIPPPFDGDYADPVHFGASLDVEGQISAGSGDDLNRAAITATNTSASATIFVRNNSTNVNAKVIQARNSVYGGNIFELTQPGDLTVRGSGTFTDKEVGFNSDGELFLYSRGQRYKCVVSGGLLTVEEEAQVLKPWDEKDKLPDSL